jgi:DNA-binding Lrp family transcriptional regulator
LPASSPYDFPAMFGKEILDALDRQMLETICTHAREGQSFNKLVEEVKPFVSRSTFAFRAKRLQRLGYIEPVTDAHNKQAKRIRGKPLMLLIIRLVDGIRGQFEEVLNSLASITEFSNNNLPSDDESRRKKKKKQILEDASQKMKEIFSLIPTYALYFGESAAGDLLLPMLMDDFKKLNSSFASLIASDKEIRTILECNSFGSHGYALLLRPSTCNVGSCS